MILFNLRCAKEHVFEGWFRNGDAYEEQAQAKSISCPVCGSRKVEKAPMAPRIGKGSADKESGKGDPRRAADVEKAATMMKALRELRDKIEAESDYVGPRFAEEARRIHYGEVESRSIYGESTEEEAEELHEEGIRFARIPWVPRHDS